MGNRYMSQFQYTIEKDTVRLFGTMVVGETGAVGTVTGLGISGIVRSDTGAYTISLTDGYNKLLMFNAVFGGGTASGISHVELAESLADQTTDIRAGEVDIICYSAGTTAADPAQNSILQFEVVCRNSSVGG